MGAYIYINGMINCEPHLSQDVTLLFKDVPAEDEFWHRNGDEDYLFSLSVRESRYHLLMECFNQIAKVKTQDSVLNEWYFVDGLATLNHEDQDRIELLRFRGGLIES